jgi:hypothetical protein
MNLQHPHCSRTDVIQARDLALPSLTQALFADQAIRVHATAERETLLLKGPEQAAD